MNAVRWVGAVVALGLAASSASACGGYGGQRELLDDLLRQRQQLLQAGAADAKRLAELEAGIDSLAGQKDASFSRLYWHRTRDAARLAAQDEGKPIVTLRLLGDLACDRSCANSRFFRTALYANERVGALLRDRAVLHWESVRPVPILTIDMGDGRRIERTITGNSVHYVTTPEGEVVDVLPGLYGPGAFEDELGRALEAARTIMALPREARPAFLRRHHLRVAARLGAVRERELGDLARWPAPAPEGRLPTAEEAARRSGAKGGVESPVLRRGPSAEDASRLAVSKGVIEAPVLRVTARTLDEAFAALARRPEQQARVLLDARSRELMRRKTRAGTSDADFAALVIRFQQRLAEDTLRNDLQLRPRALTMLADQPGLSIDALNDRVYAELFLTPRQDPWLGLDAPGEFAALEGDGLFVP